jgi:hypothetical protein
VHRGAVRRFRKMDIGTKKCVLLLDDASDAQTLRVTISWSTNVVMSSLTELCISMQSTDESCEYIHLPDVFSSFPSLDTVRFVSLDFNTCEFANRIVECFKSVHTLVMDSCKTWDWAFDRSRLSLDGVKRLEVIDCVEFLQKKELSMPAVEEIVVESTEIIETLEAREFQRYGRLNAIVLDKVFLRTEFIRSRQPPEWMRTLKVLRMCNAPIHIKNLEYVCSLDLHALETVDFTGATFVSRCPTYLTGSWDFPFEDAEDVRNASQRVVSRLVYEARRSGRWPRVKEILGDLELMCVT